MKIEEAVGGEGKGLGGRDRAVREGYWPTRADARRG